MHDHRSTYFGSSETGRPYKNHAVAKMSASAATRCWERFALRESVLLEIEGGLGEVGGAAKLAPIVLVGAGSYVFFALGGEEGVGSDDGKQPFFGECRGRAGGEDGEVAR